MDVDVAIIGGGIAGLSCAAYVSQRASVVVLEAESSLGYHTTGRSAAIYTQCSDADPIRRITLASRSYLDTPDGRFAQPLQVLFLAPAGDAAALDAMLSEFSDLADDLRILSPEEVAVLVPVIDPADTAGAVLDPGAMSLDVNAILMSYVTTVRSNGGDIRTGAAVDRIERHSGRWHVRAGDLEVTCETVVNATGAWGDQVAALAGVVPLGLTPLKRSAFTVDPGISIGDWPMVVDLDQTWYMKPEGPHLLGSAMSKLPETAGDARPDELDIALGIERINSATSLAIRSIKNQWAGLRTFASDQVPVVGFDSDAEGFFWLVGQGGSGIHTSPGMGALSAGLIADGRVPASLSQFGVTADMFGHGRFG